VHALEASAIIAIAMKDFHRDFGLGYKEVKERKRRWA
jgi:vacuolar-type H+-ATPase catalytic subunit A/Vma1